MLTVTTLKFLIDLGLCGAVLYLAVRNSRASSPGIQPDALRELESSLKRLLREATDAGADLEHSLSKKQKQLEELLFDVETVEHRINKGVEEAEAVRKELRQNIERQSVTKSPARNEASLAEQIIQEPIPSREPVRTQAISSETPSAGSEQYLGVSERAASAEFTPLPNTPLQSAIEKEVIPPTNQNVALTTTVTSSVARSIEDVYAHCEELIRAGKSVSDISRMTDIPPNEIEALQGIINLEIEEEEEAPTIVDNDTRLGVLSPKGRTNPIGRTTQVL